MFGFGKKKKEKKSKKEVDDDLDEDLDDEEVDLPKKKRVKDSDFKDLSPENKRKRKEPIKPWGFKERAIVFGVLLFMVGTSGILALNSREGKLPYLPRVEKPEIGLPFVGSEKVIVEGRSEDKFFAENVIAEFKIMTNPLTGVYGLYVVHLDTGYSFGVNHDEQFGYTSFIKLPLMATMYYEEEKGRFNLDGKYVLTLEDKTEGGGSLIGKPVGYETTYRNLLELMGKQSDMTAFNASRRIIGDQKIYDGIEKLGMEKTRFDTEMTMPKDVGNFFESIWKGNFLLRRNRDELLNTMTGTIWEAMIPSGIPDEVRVSHSYGRGIHMIHDAGIIYTKKPFVLVIMSKGVDDKEAESIIPQLARMVYEREVGR